MSWIWQLDFANQPMVFVKGKKSDILRRCFPEKPIRMTKICQKEFEKILSYGLKMLDT